MSEATPEPEVVKAPLVIVSDSGLPYPLGTPLPLDSSSLARLPPPPPFPSVLDNVKGILLPIPHFRMPEYLENFWSTHVRSLVQSIHEVVNGRPARAIPKKVKNEIRLSMGVVLSNMVRLEHRNLARSERAFVL